MHNPRSNTVYPLMTKGHLALSPTTWVTIKTASSQGLTVLLFAIQAPYLGPHAFGTMAIVMAFVSLCELILVEAAADALISIRQIGQLHYDTMNLLVVLASTAFGLSVFLGANFIAALYGDRELADILRWMALLPTLSALGAGPTGAIKREMLFESIARRTIASITIGGALGLALTFAGFGVWALVWQATVTRLVATLVLWRAAPLQLKFGFNFACARDLWRFALPTMVSRSMIALSTQLPRSVFGYLWGATPLGLFALASRLSDVSSDLVLAPRYSVARVALRRFADDPTSLQYASRDLLTNMSVFAFPICIGGAAVAPTLFQIWLDAKWADGLVPAQLLMLMGIPSVTLYCAGAILLAMNRQADEALLSFVQTGATVLCVLLLAPFGLVIASAGFAARSIISIPLAAHRLRQRCGISARLLFGSQTPALVAGATMGLALIGLRAALGQYLHRVPLLLALVGIGALIYVVMIGVMLPRFAADILRKFGFTGLFRAN